MALRRRLLLALLIAVVATAAMTFVPLLAVPSHESGLIAGALLAALLGGLSFARARVRPHDVALRWGLLAPTPGEAVLAETRANLRSAALLVAVPLVLLLSEGVRSGCRLQAGTAVYLLTCVPSALMGAALGTLVGTLTRRRRRALALAAVILVVTTAAAAAEAFIGPRTMVHHLIFGPLTVSAYMGHDTGLALPRSAYLHRGFTLVVTAGVLVGAAWARTFTDAPATPRADDGTPSGDNADRSDAGWAASRADDVARSRFLMRHHRREYARAFGLVALVAAPFLIAADRCGILPGRHVLAERLSSVLVTPHFRIHHAPGTSTEARLAPLAVGLEWDWQQVSQWLDIRPSWKVDAWIYPDSDTLFELTGARGFVFAAPWNREFHAEASRGDVAVLRHELIHVMVRDHGAWPFRASVSMGLTEGLATALDEGYARVPEVHAEVAAASAAGHVPDAATLLSLLGFADSNMDRSYRSAASFVGFLLLSRGPDAVLRGYALGDLARSCGESLPRLNDDWRRYLREQVHPTAAESLRGRERFDPARSPPLFRTPCARLGMRGAPGPAERARIFAREGMPDSAADLYCEAQAVDPAGSHLADAATQRARAGAFEAALALADRALAVERRPTWRLDSLLHQRVLLLARLHRWSDAREALARWRAAGLFESAEEVDLDEQALEAAELRDRYFEARLAAAPEDLELLGGLVEDAPDFAPALHLLLLREERWDALTADRIDAVERFAKLSPGTPVLAAEHALAAARSADDLGRWEDSAGLYALVLDTIHGARPQQRLEAEDGASRCGIAREVLAGLSLDPRPRARP